MKVGMVTTWRVSCGVAKYTEELCGSLSKLCDLKVFAEMAHQQPKENEPIKGCEDIKYERCWMRGVRYDNLIKEVKAFSPDVLHFQFQNEMYDENLMTPKTPFLDMLGEFKKEGIKVFITLHDVIAYSNDYSLGWYTSLNLNGIQIITTNKVEDIELHKWAPTSKSVTIPLGATIFEPKDRNESRKALGLSLPDFLIIQPGFLGSDKGIIELIKEMPEINKEFPDIQLLIAGSLHPLSPEVHKTYVKKCLQLGTQANASGARISFKPKFFNEEELNLLSSSADILVLNHKGMGFYIGSSASAKRLLCSGKPLIFSDLDPRLTEFEDGIQCLKIGKTRTFREAIELIRSNVLLREKLIYEAREYARETSFENIAKKHLEAYNG